MTAPQTSTLQHNILAQGKKLYSVEVYSIGLKCKACWRA